MHDPHTPARPAYPMQDLDTLCPSPLVVSAGGRTIEVTPIRVRELSPFARAVEPLVTALVRGEQVARLLAEHTGSVIHAVAVGARVDPDWVEGLGLDELLDLADAVLTVNLDFFARRLQPRLVGAAESLTGAMSTAGSSSTPASAPPGSEASST